MPGFDPSSAVAVADSFDPESAQPVTPEFDPESAVPVSSKTLGDFLAEPNAESTLASPVTPGVLPAAPGPATVSAVPLTERALLAVQTAGLPATPIGEQPAAVPRFGAPGTLARGASETLGGLIEWALNKPEEALATLTPLAPAIAARYAPEIAVQFGKDIAAGVRGDREALGRALTVAALVGGPKALAKTREGALINGEPAAPIERPVDVAAQLAQSGAPNLTVRDAVNLATTRPPAFDEPSAILAATPPPTPGEVIAPSLMRQEPLAERAPAGIDIVNEQGVRFGPEFWSFAKSAPYTADTLVKSGGALRSATEAAHQAAFDAESAVRVEAPVEPVTAEPLVNESAAAAAGEAAPTEPGPGLVGMGGALEGEVSAGGGEDIFGIAQRVREEMAATGRYSYTPPGEGTTAWESIQHGRALLARGADPLEALANAEATKRFSSDDVALIRAHMEKLDQDARAAAARYGTVSPQFAAAQAKANDWFVRSKQLGTEWHKMGQAQQGMTDVDTGDLISVTRDYRAATGKDLTPPQTAQAERVTKAVKQAREEASASQKAVTGSIEKDIEAKGKGGAKPAPPAKTLDEARQQYTSAASDPVQRARTLWQYAKDNYINKGEANLDAIAQGVADAFGLPKRTVVEALAGSKGTRRITDEMYLKMARARQTEAAARAWLLHEKQPAWTRWRVIPNAFRTAKTLGHGSVGGITHAAPLMFDPVHAVPYWRNFGRQYPMMGSEAFHERMMQDLMHRPTFAMWRRAGLANDPFRFSDDFQNPEVMQQFGWLSRMGNRGFDALKTMRQEVADQIWGTIDSKLRTPETAKGIAERVNHLTGVTSQGLGRFTGAANTIFFAPRLELSRWALAFGDPAKALKSFATWKSATPAERMNAVATVKQHARILGTYGAALAANETLLQLASSDRHINFTDPHRTDFWSFKVAGYNLGVLGPLLSIFRFLADVHRMAQGDRGKVEALESRRGEAGARAAQYVTGKLSPFAQTASDLYFQHDFKGRPMPYSEDRVAKRDLRRGIEPYNWGEYALQQSLPIPFAEALNEVWESQGVNGATREAWLRALPTFIISGGTGARLREDTSP